MTAWTSGEAAIHKAVQTVETMGADPKLTQVVVLLGEAQELLADYVDERDVHG
jgi:hypothetical protein